MSRFITQILAIDPQTGELEEWAGPDIEADSFEEAARYCELNLGYCKVIGEKISEHNHSNN